MTGPSGCSKSMRPPAPKTGPRKSSSKLRTRKNGSSGKRPKRLTHISPVVQGRRPKDAGKKNLSSFLSPDMFRAGSKSPSTILTPPPFNVSFGSDLNDEVLLYMDKLDGPAICSTPHTVSSSSQNPMPSSIAACNHKASDMNISGTPLFDISNTWESRELVGLSTPNPVHRSSFMQTPAKHVQDHLKLASWGLPEKVLEQYVRRGITSMFEWQAECLMLPTVLSGGNLVYSAPTSAGKTLVAELLALKCVLETKKKVIIILPFVSIAQEKSNYLQKIFEPVGVKVGGFMGSQAPSGGLAAVDIAVCTIEKANSLINHLLEENATHKLGAVIVDELHMVGDSHRGYLLELLLTKLLYVGRTGKVGTFGGNEENDVDKSGGVDACGDDGSIKDIAALYTIQLIGMSATLPNLDALAAWLSAQLYHTDFRPVPLREMVKIGVTLYDTGFQKVRELEKVEGASDDENDVLSLCKETVLHDHSVLIFCPTKSWCENLALTIAGGHFLQQPTEGLQEGTAAVSTLNQAALLSVCEQLRRTQVGLDQVLKKTIPHGVAFHHAGLTLDEREIIEGAFRQSLIKILVATSTLSAGVNLPARMVIIRTPFFQRSLLDVQVYKQMVGRAGRKGEDSEGDSVLICKPSERSKVIGLLKSTPKPVESCLGQTKSTERTRGATGNDMSAMRRALLEVVASQTANTIQDLMTYVSCTLLFADVRRKASLGRSPARKRDSEQPTRDLLQSTLQYLVENEFIAVRNCALQGEGKQSPNHASPGTSLQDSLECYPTQLGVATVASALSPEEALIVFGELLKARKSFVLENELHIVYLVTPVYIQRQWPRIDWYKYLCLWERLPPDMRHVADTLGIRESFLARAIQGRIPERTAAQRESVRIHQRFFTALALHDLVHEVPMVEVARRYGASKGLLQSLQGAAGTFAGMVTVFCARLGWRNLELLLSQFQSRLTFGVERELCDLVRISLLNGFRARVLFNSGFHTLSAIATANPVAIETCLRNAVPFKSHKAEENKCGSDHTTWSAKLRKGMSEHEAAVNIIQEAQIILSKELNIPSPAWAKLERPPMNAIHSPPTKVSTSPTVPQNPPPSTDCMTVTAELRAGFHRGQRKSPNDGITASHCDIKKPRLALVSGSESMDLPGQSKCSVQYQEWAYVPPEQVASVGLEPLPEVKKERQGITGTVEAHTTLPTGFMPASTLLRQKGEDLDKQQLVDSCPPGQTVEHRGPLLPNQPSSHTLQTKSTPLQPYHSPSLDGIHNVSSEDQPLTIPDSMDMSVSFGCQTLAEIDAVCASVEREQEDFNHVEGNDFPTHSTTSNEMDTDAKPPPSHDIQRPQSSTNGQLNAGNGTSETAVWNGGADKPAFELKSALAGNDPCLHQLPSHDSKPSAVKGTCEVLQQPSHNVTATTSSLRDLSSSICSSQLSQCSGVTVITVTSNVLLFETFVSECRDQKLVSFSVATQSTNAKTGIGSAIVSSVKVDCGIRIGQQNEEVMGVAFCWGETDVYYVSLCQEDSGDAIHLSSRITAVKQLLTGSSSCKSLIAYDFKHHANTLLTLCGGLPSGVVMDPCVASWMLDPDAKEKTIHKMVLQYLPEQPTLSEDEDCEDIPLSSLATHATSPHVRASAESVLASLLMSKLQTLLQDQDLYDAFVKVEMPSLLVLAKLEFNGIGFSPEECNNLKSMLEVRLLELEREAYGLASRSFSLTSPEDIARVLFIELKLPSSEEESLEKGKLQKTLGPHTRRAKKRLQHLSTAKEVLERIKHLHPLPGVILEWRRISSTITKTIFPLFKGAVAHDTIQSVRLHPTCQIHTATGRITMTDPSLQMVPKEYDIGGSCHHSPAHDSEGGGGLLSETQALGGYEDSKQEAAPPPYRPSSVCMRNTFIAFPGGVFLAADYSQLELRILAHVSGDNKLQRLLNQEGDVFKMIAGEWLGIPPGEVSNKQRQEAKQVCYGMVYGIGAKALGKQLEVSEDDAAQFMESFKSKYQTMKRFLAKTIQDCRDSGCVTTLLGRKRFLPSIHSSNVHARSQAERQAVNSTIQGSAADLVNTAMVKIDKRLQENFSHSHLPLSEGARESTQPLQCDFTTRPSGAYLVLQLHDELLYEVCEKDLEHVLAIVRHEMENALQLSVKFPVKIKVGPSWGRLEDYQGTG